jgi:hypothetical protein
MPALVGIGALELIVLARYAGVVQWHRPSAWILLGLLVSLVLTGGYGTLLAGRIGSAPPSAAQERTLPALLTHEPRRRPPSARERPAAGQVLAGRSVNMSSCSAAQATRGR